MVRKDCVKVRKGFVKFFQRFRKGKKHGKNNRSR